MFEPEASCKLYTWEHCVPYFKAEQKILIMVKRTLLSLGLPLDSSYGACLSFLSSGYLMSEWDNNSQSLARTPPLRAMVPREVEELQNPQAFRKVPRAEKRAAKEPGSNACDSFSKQSESAVIPQRWAFLYRRKRWTFLSRVTSQISSRVSSAPNDSYKM